MRLLNVGLALFGLGSSCNLRLPDAGAQKNRALSLVREIRESLRVYDRKQTSDKTLISALRPQPTRDNGPIAARQCSSVWKRKQTPHAMNRSTIHVASHQVIATGTLSQSSIKW